jgi:hypothetical protein
MKPRVQIPVPAKQTKRNPFFLHKHIMCFRAPSILFCPLLPARFLFWSSPPSTFLYFLKSRFYVRKNMWYFCLGLIYFAKHDNIQSIHFPANYMVSYFFVTDSVVCIRIFCIHSCIDRHLVCSHNLAIVNSAAISTSMQVSLLYADSDSFGIHPGVV